MKQGNEGDFVLIIDDKDTYYFKIGKIIQVHYHEYENVVKSYVIEFVEGVFEGVPLRKMVYYDGYIFDDYRAKILNFKELF